MFMGNRGCLHDNQGAVRRDWQVRRWITCLTAFKARQRQLMRPGHYTELFFMDEAVATAAGHRPCAECRRADHLAFRAAWQDAHGPVASVDQIDAALHLARLGPRQVRPAQGLPDGSMVLWQNRPHLVLDKTLLPWSPLGYEAARPWIDSQVCVLTPAPLIAVLAAGWQPAIHPTALRNQRV
ncbi:hypothetical protein [Fuscibacter oryzae]|uniref:Metal binding domain of Ada n=1 Tax=Fuscibacter oryzae TaxID=2803939 RepID=A0A8J7MNK9_9RHOB|nr:hypothetical protein [Fuscibacter oryzae]MBL4927101.1 hypothetical protein [Fuscibacter oryzae]